MKNWFVFQVYSGLGSYICSGSALKTSVLITNCSWFSDLIDFFGLFFQEEEGTTDIFREIPMDSVVKESLQSKLSPDVSTHIDFFSGGHRGAENPTKASTSPDLVDQEAEKSQVLDKTLCIRQLKLSVPICQGDEKRG